MSLDIDVAGMSSDEIDALKVEKEKELMEATRNQGAIEEANHRLAKQIMELRIKKKDSDIALDKARYNAKILNSEIKILTSAFWNTRRDERGRP